MRFILTATRKSDSYRLHLINRHTEHHGFVVCWNYSKTSNSWDWGSYCNSLKEALSLFSQKVTEYDFDDVTDEQSENGSFEFEERRNKWRNCMK